MPKPIDLPPTVARNFVKDMLAFLAKKDSIKRDEIAARQIHCVSAKGPDHDRHRGPVTPIQQNQWTRGVPSTPKGVIFRSEFTLHVRRCGVVLTGDGGSTRDATKQSILYQHAVLYRHAAAVGTQAGPADCSN